MTVSNAGSEGEYLVNTTVPIYVVQALDRTGALYPISSLKALA